MKCNLKSCIDEKKHLEEALEFAGRLGKFFSDEYQKKCLFSKTCLTFGCRNEGKHELSLEGNTEGTLYHCDTCENKEANGK